MAPSRTWSKLLLLIGVAVLADQAVHWTVLRDGWFLGAPVAPFDPPLFGAEQRDSLERLRAAAAGGDRALIGAIDFDAELGWVPRPSSGSGELRYDAAGARIGCGGAEDDGASEVVRLAVFGCSFAHGDEVAAREAWTAVLDARLPGARVANFGVGGYGIDQALLRYRRLGKAAAAAEVWLAVMPEALLRLLSVYRPALRHRERSVSFKPRFRLDAGGALELLPNPARALGDYPRLLGDTAAFAAAVGATDAFVARALPAYLPFGSHWSHRSAVARLALTRTEAGWRELADWLADPSGELPRLAEAVVAEFARAAAAAGARFRVIVLPDQKSLAARARAGDRGCWQGLLDRLELRGIAVTDLSPALVAAGACADGALWAPGGHYSARGNARVAELLLPLLESE